MTRRARKPTDIGIPPYDPTGLYGRPSIPLDPGIAGAAVAVPARIPTMYPCTAQLRPGQEPTVRVTLEIPAAHVAGALQRLPESIQAWVRDASQLEPAYPMPQYDGLGGMSPFIEKQQKLADEVLDLQRRQVTATERLADKK